MLPYVVHTYPYRNNSAGLRCCHRLVHLLNEQGFLAFSSQPEVNPTWNELDAPSGLRDFVAVYPEVVHGNPFDAPYVVRWLLNYQGRLGGPKEYSPSDKVFAHDQSIADAAPRIDGLLFVSIIERDIFKPDINATHIGKCYYVGKGKKTGYESVGIEIRSDWPSTRIDVAKLLKMSEVLVCYDGFTVLIDEARLCGCPVVFPGGVETSTKHGSPGIAFGFEELDQARRTVSDFAEQYDWMCESSKNQLVKFVEKTCIL